MENINNDDIRISNEEIKELLELGRRLKLQEHQKERRREKSNFLERSSRIWKTLPPLTYDTTRPNIKKMSNNTTAETGRNKEPLTKSSSKISRSIRWKPTVSFNSYTSTQKNSGLQQEQQQKSFQISSSSWKEAETLQMATSSGESAKKPEDSQSTVLQVEEQSIKKPRKPLQRRSNYQTM